MEIEEKSESSDMSLHQTSEETIDCVVGLSSPRGQNIFYQISVENDSVNFKYLWRIQTLSNQNGSDFPMLVNLLDQTVIIGNVQGSLKKINLKNGKTLWSCVFKKNLNIKSFKKINENFTGILAKNGFLYILETNYGIIK